MKQEESACKGCKTYYYSEVLGDYRCAYGLKPYTIINSTTEMCPCIKCIIKSMCNRECEDYKKYRELNGRRSVFYVEGSKRKVSVANDICLKE